MNQIYTFLINETFRSSLKFQSKILFTLFLEYLHFKPDFNANSDNLSTQAQA